MFAQTDRKSNDATYLSIVLCDYFWRFKHCFSFVYIQFTGLSIDGCEPIGQLSVGSGGQPKKMRKSIKSFFGTANKFQRAMKRSGVYFACLIYHEDRVLVTNDELLPIIEIGKIFSIVYFNNNTLLIECLLISPL